MDLSSSAASLNSSTGTTTVAHTRRSAGRHRMRPTAVDFCPPWQRRRNEMAERCCEFVDNRLRRCPPDRASAVPYGQAGENALRFPHLAHRSAAVHKLHSATATSRFGFDSGRGETFSRLRALAYSSRNLSRRPGPPHTTRSFCSRCGTPLTYETKLSPHMVNISRGFVFEPHRASAALPFSFFGTAGLGVHRCSALSA
jgi:hypothetical protein